MRWRLRLSEFTFDVQYKPSASHHVPEFMSRTANGATPEPIDEDIPCLALAETAKGLSTKRYTGTDMPAPVELDDIVEAQQSDGFRTELAGRIAKQTAKDFFRHESHAIYRRLPHGDQLVIPSSLQERLLKLKHHATTAAHPG